MIRASDYNWSLNIKLCLIQKDYLQRTDLELLHTTRILSKPILSMGWLVAVNRLSLICGGCYHSFRVVLRLVRLTLMLVLLGGRALADARFNNV